MPALLSPAALWTLLTLGLPLVLHLRRPPPRTVQLGSLRFLQGTARRPWRNLRWRERLLLFARLALLALLALFLAGLRWQRPPSTRPEHWAWLEADNPLTGESRNRLRALQRDGYQTSSLSPAPDLWSLLRENDDTLPPRSKVVVFSPLRLASLRGLRPTLRHCQVEWVETVAPSEAQTEVAAKRDASPPLRIAIYCDADRTEDARYAQAALTAVAESTGRTFDVRLPPPGTALLPTNGADWIFWLGAEPPPETFSAHTANLFCEAASGSVLHGPDWGFPLPGLSISSAIATPVRLWRRGPVPSGAAVWTDAAGRPLLTRARGEFPPLTRWMFASRFHPDWTDLPRTPAFPALLRSLLLPASNPPLYTDPNHDFRLADLTQFQVSKFPAVNAAPEPTVLPRTWDLRGFLWLLAAASFVAERLLSSRQVVTTGLGVPRPVFSR